MNNTIVLLLLAFYFHMGWCWTGIFSAISGETLTPCKCLLVPLLWPFSMILTDAKLEEFDDDQC